MNFISNKNFYQRIGRIDIKNLQNLKKKIINKSDVQLVRPAKNLPSTNEDTIKSVTIPEEFIDKPIVAEVENRTSFLDSIKSNSYVVVVITEGRGFAQGEIGIASIDLHAPILFLSQFSDEFWYNGFITKLNLLQPNEIIIPYTIYHSDSKIVSAIKDNFSTTKLIPLPRRHFNIEDGIMMINELCSIECKSSIKFIEKRYYTVVAASALLKYVKQILTVNFVKGGLKIEYQGKCGTMLIDHDTCHRLELLYPTCQTKQKRSCLYGILDHTVTVIGKRQLRAKILEPYCDLQKILQIQESIKELKNDPELFLLFEEKLQKFWNVDKILKIVVVETEENKMKSVELMFDKILLLKSILNQIPELADFLRNCKSTIFTEAYKILMDERYSVMLTTIDDVIRPEAQFSRGTTQHFNRIQAIQDGYDEMLDFSRSSYTKLTDTVRDTVKELALKNEIPLRMMYMATKGFYMQLTIPKSNLQIQLPPNTSMFHRKGNVLYLTNPELVKLNVRINEVINEIYEISDRILRELIVKLSQYIDVNHYLIGIISNLDIIQSYSKASLNNDFCCPIFGDETRVIDAVHPLLEHSKTKSLIVRNNIIATPEYNVFVITGPNMGGKTIYIKMIAILQIMAQLGCFIPASDAKFKLCDRVFTRIGFEDTTEQNGSSFEIEIREIEYILKNITPNSLVIIDELCRSTNPTDGKKIARQICEKFCTIKGFKNYQKNIEDDNFDQKSISLFETEKNEKNTNLTAPFVFLTTHFIHLTRLSDKYLNVINLHVEAKEKFSDGILNLEYTHKVKEGATPIKGYGISLAHSVRFNERILSRAYEILNDNAGIQNEANSSTDASSYFMENIFTNFEKNLNQTFSNFLIENNFNQSTISNFMNGNESRIKDNENEKENSMLHNVSVKDLLKDVQYKLYDTFAKFAEIFRNTQSEITENSSDINQKIVQIIDNLISNLPKPLLTEIKNDGNPTINNNENIEKTMNNNHQNTSNIVNTNTEKNLNLNDQKVVRENDNDINVSWSKLYPDMSFHSFIRKIANGEITLPQIEVTKENPCLDDSKSKLQTSTKAKDSINIEILENNNAGQSREKIQPIEGSSNLQEERVENHRETVLDLSSDKNENKNERVNDNKEKLEQKQRNLRSRKRKSKACRT